MAEGDASEGLLSRLGLRRGLASGKKPLTGCALAVRRVKSRGECC